MKEDDPHAVKLMIDYFYGCDYDDAPENIIDFSNVLELNAAVYVVADKYQVPDLKKLACKRFADAAPASALRNEDPSKAIILAFNSTPTTDRPLRDLVLDYWITFAEVLVLDRGPALTSIAREAPDFAAEALLRHVQGSTLTFTTCPDSYHPPQSAKGVVEVFNKRCARHRQLLSEHEVLTASRSSEWVPFWVKRSDA